jgi:hypothetical protein
MGIVFVIASLFARSDFVAALIGALGASLIWGSTELKEQAIRGELGWYPFHDRKKQPPFAETIRKWKAPSL